MELFAGLEAFRLSKRLERETEAVCVVIGGAPTKTAPTKRGHGGHGSQPRKRRGGQRQERGSEVKHSAKSGQLPLGHYPVVTGFKPTHPAM
jgi:hypothetical protein